MAFPVAIGDAQTIVPNNCAFGIYVSGGAYYTVAIEQNVAATNFKPRVFKASDPGVSWAAQDTAHETTSATAVTTAAALGLGVFQNGTDLHIAYITNIDGTYNLRVAVYSMATDTWTRNESVQSSVTILYSCDLVVRSNGDVILFAIDNAPSAKYFKRTAGAWGASVLVSSTTLGTTSNQGLALLGASDRVHFLYYNGTLAPLNHRSLSSADALDTESTTAGTNPASGHIAGIAYTDGVSVRLRVLYYNVTTNLTAMLKADSGANPAWTTETLGDAAAANTNNPAIANDGTTLHAFWRRASDNFLVHDQSVSNGGSWGTDGLRVSIVQSRWAASVVTKGISTVAGMLYVNSGLFYTELVLRGAANLTQTQSVSLIRTVSRKFALTQAQSLSLQKAALRALALTQAQSVTKPVTASRSFSLTQAQSLTKPPVTAGRSFSASQPQVISLGAAAISRFLALTQPQVVARTLALSRFLALTQAQSVAQPVLASRMLLVAQAQALGLQVNVNRIVSAAQAQSLTMGPVPITRSFVLTQGATPSVRAAISRALSLNQAQTPTLSGVVSRFAPVLAQPQLVSMGVVVGRVLSVAQVQAVSLGPASIGRAFALTQGATPLVASSRSTALNLGQGQIVTLTGNPSRVFSVTQGQAVQLGAATRIFILSQGATIIVGSAIARSFSLSQGQAVTVIRASSSFISLSQAQIATRIASISRILAVSGAQLVSRRIQASRIFAPTQGQGVSIMGARSSILSVSQGQLVSRAVSSVGRRLAVAQGQLVSTRRGQARAFITIQPQTVGLGRALVLTLTASQSVNLSLTSRHGQTKAFVLSQPQNVSLSEGTLGRTFRGSQSATATLRRAITHGFSVQQEQLVTVGAARQPKRAVLVSQATELVDVAGAVGSGGFGSSARDNGALAGSALPAADFESEASELTPILGAQS